MLVRLVWFAMARSIVVTFGWTESPVIGAIVRHGFEPGDRIILLKPVDRDERAEKAISDLRAFLSNLAGVELVEKEVDVRSFVDAVIAIKRLLDRERLNRNVIVNLSGGMRILVLAAYLASLFTRNVKLEIETENRKVWTALPSINISQLSRLKRNHVRILRLLQISKGVSSVRDLLSALKLPRSTFYACVRDLKDMELVESYGKGLLKITDKGNLLTILLGGW